MHRICGSLAAAGYEVWLVGRKLKTSLPPDAKAFHQKRIRCFFNNGFWFYAEYNLRLFFFLLFKRMDAVCAIDLDTILPCLFVSKIKKAKRIYDAHEYFTELKEVRTRPGVRKIWLAIEKFAVPQYRHGYTVSEGLAQEFEKNYKRNYEVIRNLPVLKNLPPIQKTEKFLVFQGAVNEARGFEYLIPALSSIPYRLVVCGDGNFMSELKRLIEQHRVKEKVELKGMMKPEELQPIARQASLGIGLAEKEGINQFYALPNKFLEYMHAGLPQIAMDYPEYRKINDHYKIALLLDQLSAEAIAATINAAMNNDGLLNELHTNALKAREIYCWQNEEKRLINFYQKLLDA